MDSVCIDASTAIAAVLQYDPDHAKALAYVKQLAQQNVMLCAPSLFTYECDAVIRLQVFRGKLTREDAEAARALIDEMGVIIEYEPLNSERAFEIACNYHQPRAYDASYAAHAEALGIDFATVDDDFFQSVNGNKLPRNTTALSFVKLINSNPKAQKNATPN